MSEPKFTKGLWKANFDDYTKPYVAILLGVENIEANINLIAAAPDMYEALECACDKYCIGYAGDSLVKCEDCVIQKVLRKARGETE